MTASLYTLLGVGLIAIALYATVTQAHLLRKVLALNVLGAGVFMLLITVAYPTAKVSEEMPAADPVPHALVLTGLVVAVSATALALALISRYYDETGRSTLPEDDNR